MSSIPHGNLLAVIDIWDMPFVCKKKDAFDKLNKQKVGLFGIFQNTVENYDSLGLETTD